MFRIDALWIKAKKMGNEERSAYEEIDE